MIFLRLQSPFLFAAYAAYAARCRGPLAGLLYCLLALSSPLNVELVLPMHLFCKSLFSLFSSKLFALLEKRAQWSDQPVAYCPARPAELTHLLTIHLFPHTRASSSYSIFTLLLVCFPPYHALACPPKLSTKFLSSYNIFSFLKFS